ncbi:DUF3048 domain-containing protein [Amycolatopsis alkalitolerans]|uniref:DUF3048 domain-containing protein n=1 Tax=Amycolatopsis alkalitolerans TaxID=2547244 RepID=A0A5C4LS99_9PSEU|nr:DUF3048 domain-containing protein [Amycolatopsis alkalitolerans]TNC21822.1 DUF3048 domain-containing protein [Amycolatopsis alkalitolerans]
MRRKQVLVLVAVVVVLAAAALVAVFLIRSPGGNESASPPPPGARPAGPVLVVKIDNVAEARPATGLGSADVIYVEPVEGGLTRIAAVFTANRPAVIGPVRSARETDLDLLGQYGRPVFAYSGAAPPVVQALHAAPVSDRVVNASPGDTPDAYFRQGGNAPHNLYLHPAALPTSQGTSPEAVLPRGSAPAGGTPATDQTATLGGVAFGFHWDGERWQISMSGTPFTSTESGQLSAATVIVQRVTATTGGLVGASPVARTIGTGQVTVLRDGQAFHGTWSRPSLTAGTSFATDSGALLTAAPGPVWILLAPT